VAKTLAPETARLRGRGRKNDARPHASGPGARTTAPGGSLWRQVRSLTPAFRVQYAAQISLSPHSGRRRQPRA